jgi:hypothetical protein
MPPQTPNQKIPPIILSNNNIDKKSIKDISNIDKNVKIPIRHVDKKDIN